MSDLRRAAVDVGYQSVVGKTTFEKLKEVKVPVVVGISPEGHDHFVVFRGTYGVWVYVADPIRGNMRMPIREFTKQWQENAILVVHKPGKKVKTTSPLHVSREKRIGLDDQPVHPSGPAARASPTASGRESVSGLSAIGCGPCVTPPTFWPIADSLTSCYPAGC